MSLLSIRSLSVCVYRCCECCVYICVYWCTVSVCGGCDDGDDGYCYFWCSDVVYTWIFLKPIRMLRQSNNTNHDDVLMTLFSQHTQWYGETWETLHTDSFPIFERITLINACKAIQTRTHAHKHNSNGPKSKNRVSLMRVSVCKRECLSMDVYLCGYVCACVRSLSCIVYNTRYI